MEQKRINKVTKIILDIMFYGGILVFITLPLSLKWAGRHYSQVIADHFLPMLFIFGIAGIFGIMIISQLRRMMRTVLEESCFVHANVKSLQIMAVLSLAISIVFIIKLLIIPPTPATGIIILVFFIAALFSQVLANVFAEAIRYKEETDLTI